MPQPLRWTAGYVATLDLERNLQTPYSGLDVSEQRPTHGKVGSRIGTAGHLVITTNRRVTAELPDVGMLVVTIFEDNASLFAVLRAGADGCL